MTRQDFIDEISDMDDLYGFCENNNVEYLMDDYYSESGRDDQIDNDIREAICHRCWESVRDELNVIPECSSTGWYYKNGELDYTAVGYEDFENQRDYVAEHMSENGFFDEEEPEEQEPVSEPTPIITYEIEDADTIAFLRAFA